MKAARTELEGKGVEFVGSLFEYGSVKLAAFKDVSGNVLQKYEHAL